MSALTASAASLRTTPTRHATRRRVVIEDLQPSVDEGRFSAKRCVGDELVVEADIFTDGHDAVRAVLQCRHDEDSAWDEVPFAPLGNDRWRATTVLDRVGLVHLDVEAWVDPFDTWRADLGKRVAADQDVAVDRRMGTQILHDLPQGTSEGDRTVAEWIRRLSSTEPLTLATLEELDARLAPVVHRRAPRP